MFESSNLKIFINSRSSASNFKSFSRSIEQFFLTVGQNNFGNKIPFLEFFLNSLGIGTPIRGHSDFKRNLKQEGKTLRDQSNTKITIALASR